MICQKDWIKDQTTKQQVRSDLQHAMDESHRKKEAVLDDRTTRKGKEKSLRLQIAADNLGQTMTLKTTQRRKGVEGQASQRFSNSKTHRNSIL